MYGESEPISISHKMILAQFTLLLGSEKLLFAFLKHPLPVVSAKGSVLAANALTANERKALTFFNLDSALEWCDTNLDDFVTDNYTSDPNKYDWDNPVIVQNDFIVIPL